MTGADRFLKAVRAALTRRPRPEPPFPFELVRTTGADAPATWERLQSAGRGWPVVIGNDGNLRRAIEQWRGGGGMAPDRILRRADALREVAGREPGGFDDLLRLQLSETLPAGWAGEDDDRSWLDEPAASWPDQPPPLSDGLTLAKGWTGSSFQPHPVVHIALLPTDEPAAAPALLRWGGWNAVPPSHYLVAHLRRWHQRFGAVPAGMGADTWNVRVERRPATREAALDLAREHVGFCGSLIEQDSGMLMDLAASLMRDDWWYFWWD